MSENPEIKEEVHPDAVESEETMNIVVKTSKERGTFQISVNADVKKLRELVSERYQIEPNHVCLIFSGKILKDGDLLQNHKMKDGHIVHLVIRDVNKLNSNSESSTSSTQSTPFPASSSSSTTTSNTSQTSTTSASNNTSNTNSFSSMFGALFGQNSGVDGGGGGSGGGGASILGDLDQQLAQQFNNPEFMRQMMDNPIFQNIYSNPEIFRSLITNNPQFQQLIERNPELNHVLSNPEVLRQTFDMMRNPAAFQELMRSHDRALSNLESLPGGYNALRRMYTEFQEPMLNAAQEQFGANSFASTNSLASTVTTTPSNTENREPLPNPWDRSANSDSSNNSTTGAGSNTTTTSSNRTASPFGSLFNSGSMQAAMEQVLSNPSLLQNMMNNPFAQNLMQTMTSDPNLTSQLLSQFTSPSTGGTGSTPSAANGFNLPSLLNNSSSQSSLVQRIIADPQAVQAVNQIQLGYAQLERILGVRAANINISDISRELASNGLTSSASTITTTSTASSAVTSANTAQTTTTPSSLSGTQPTATSTDALQYPASATALTQMMQQMFRGAQLPGQSAQPLEVRYQIQLTQLEQMGFTNREANLRALAETLGNVEAAIDRLLLRM